MTKDYAFPNGLNESYSVVKSQILIMNPLPSVNQVYSLINEEEMGRGITTTLSKHTRSECSNFFKVERTSFFDAHGII